MLACLRWFSPFYKKGIIMRGLIKFTLLIFAFCLKVFAIDFANIHISFYDGRTSFPSSSTYKKVNDVEFLLNSYLRIGNLVYSYSTSGDNLFNLFLKKGDGFYSDEGMSKLEFYDSSHEKYTVYCESNTARSCSFEASTSYPAPVEFSFFKTYYISYFVTCPADEHFNTDAKKCQKCPEGQTWNPKTNSCFIDCTDEKTNKWGWSDGSCTDCSASKTTQDVYRCFCGSLGLGVPPTITDVGVIGKPGYFKGQCADGNMFEYRDPEYKPDPKPDDNKTKPDDPKPNPDDPKPDPGGDSGGGNSGGGSGGGNSGDSQDNPKPNPGGGSGDNPDPKPNPNPGGGSGGGNNGGKDDGNNKDGEAKFNKGDFDDGDLEKERNSLYNGIVKHINDNLSKFDGIREGVDQFLKNVQGKGFETVKTSIKSKCPMKKEIPLPNGGSKDITVDLCEYVSPASEISYYAFYVGFAVGGFLLFLKLLIFSF